MSNDYRLLGLDPEKFTKELADAVEADAARAVEDMDSDTCVAFTREFLLVLQAWQPGAIDLEGKPLEGVARALLAASLFRHCFAEAYCYSNRFVQAKHSIENVFQDEN